LRENFPGFQMHECNAQTLILPPFGPKRWDVTQARVAALEAGLKPLLKLSRMPMLPKFLLTRLLRQQKPRLRGLKKL
jgi:hypothetical protein